MATTKICPACKKPFTRRKKNCCPNCAEPLYYPRISRGPLKGQVFTSTEKEAVDFCLKQLEAKISDRDGVPFEFDAPGKSREYLVLWSIVDRARKYLSQIPNAYGWTPASFTIELITGIVDGWASSWIKSYMQINASVAQAAHDMYRNKKQQEQAKSNQRSTFVELSKFVQGDGYAYHPGFGTD